ncbi:MAG: MlaD family protein [Magnetospiraceae bacterium]
MSFTAEEIREIAVGAVLFLALAVLILFSYGREPEIGSGGYRLQAVFERVDGLELGAEVRLSGITVGRVVAMALDEHFRAEVTVEVQSALGLPEDTSASIQSDSLFGGKHVVLEPGGAEENLPDGGHIDMTQQSLVMEDLLNMIIAEGRAKLGLEEDEKAEEDK